MVRYSGHGLNSKLKVCNSRHGLNNKLKVGAWRRCAELLTTQNFKVIFCCDFGESDYVLSDHGLNNELIAGI